MARAAAIILQNNEIALIERNRNGQVYYLFPGGQVEEGESQIETVVREVREELGFEVTVGPLIAEIIFKGKSQFYYLVEIVSGEFGTGTGVEMLGLVPSEYGTYTPIWIPIDGLLNLDIRPRVVADLVVQSHELGWPAKHLVSEESN